MPFEVPSFQDLRDFLIAAFSGRFPNHNVSRYSDNYKRMSIVALGLADVHSHVRRVGQDLFPDTAETEELRRWGNIWGVPRKGATGSTGALALRVFGDPAATFSIDEPLTHTPSGLQFKTAAGGTIPAGSYLDVGITAVSLGSQTNLDADSELQFDTPPVNIEAIARLVIDLENGTDVESIGAFRARVLNRIGEPAAGGNRNDFENFVLEAEDYVDDAFVYPNRNGGGTVDLAALKSGTGSARLLDAGERADVLAAVELIRPVTATIRVLEVVTLAQDVELTVTPENSPTYSFDWDDSVLPTVSGYVAGTRTVTLNAARPASMGVGDRVIAYNGGSDSDGREMVIESLVATDGFVVADDFGFTIPATTEIYSGSPITEPIRAAVKALFDALGPANPQQKYGPWESAVRLSTLFAAVQLTTGVLDSVIDLPVATVDATDFIFPANDQVELLIPGNIFVKRSH